MKLYKGLSMILVACWLILFGLLSAPMLQFSFTHSGNVLAVLAVAAGVVLLVQR